MTHELKTLPAYWDAVQRGEKRFEVRRDDRGFKQGDTVALIRHDGAAVTPSVLGSYTCSRIQFRIGYILTGGQFGIEPGYVVFSLEAME